MGELIHIRVAQSDAFRYIAVVEPFRLHSFAVQLSYPNAYLLWDVSGRVTATLTKIWPGYKLQKAEPGTVVGVSDKAQVDVGLDRSFVKLFRPATLMSEIDRVVDTVECWLLALGVSEISKLGLRAVYIKEFNSREDSAKFFMEMGLTRPPKRRVFNCAPDSKLITGSVAYQFEDDAVLNMIRVYSQDLRIDVENMEDFPEISIKQDKHRIVIDVDRQTKKSIAPDTLRIGESVKGFAHLINRDLTEVVGDYHGL